MARIADSSPGAGQSGEHAGKQTAAQVARPPRARTARPGRGLSFAIAPAHVRTLLWLRWKLTLRGYTRSPRRLVGLIAQLLLLVPLAGLLAFGTGAGYLLLPRPDATQLLFVVLALLYLTWAALPLLQYTLNEGLDVTKLQTYPLTRGEQMVSLVLSTLLDVSALVIVALFVAIGVGWHASPLALAVTVLALVVAYVHIVGLSQFTLAALMGMLRSRRYRDISIIVFTLSGTLCSVGSQVLSRAIAHTVDVDRFDPSSLHLDAYLQWTPPGMAARAIALADQGMFAQAALWLAGSAALIPVLLWLWAVALDRGITTAESGGGGPRRRRGPLARLSGKPASAGGYAAGAGRDIATAPAAASMRTARAARRGWQPLPAASLAIARKDALYLWRDPQMKAALFSAVLPTIFILLPRLYFGDPTSATAGGVSALQVYLAPIPALFIAATLAGNAFGMERQGLQTLFLYPIRPLAIYWGKNLVIGALALAVELALTLILGALAGAWAAVPLALVMGLAALLVMLGCGNVTSTLLPFRVRQMRMGETSSLASENGCLRSILLMASFAATVILVAPVAVALAAPLLLDHREWLVVTLPVALLYGVAFYQLATRLSAPRLLRRAPEILAATTREA